MVRGFCECKKLDFRKFLNMKKVILSLLLLLALKSFSQEKPTIFVNEANEKISDLEFYNKKKSKLYYSYAFNLDTVAVKKVFLKYRMGKLKNDHKTQLFSLLKQRNNVDTTKSILIHYKDTLSTIKSLPKHDAIVHFTNGQHKHIQSFKSLSKTLLECIQKNTKKAYNIYHFYNFNKGMPVKIKKTVWFKDHLNLLRKFFYNYSNTNNIWAILIHPNGNFVINRAGVKSGKAWKEMKKGKNWEKHLADFQESYHRLNPQLKKGEYLINK